MKCKSNHFHVQVLPFMYRFNFAFVCSKMFVEYIRASFCTEHKFTGTSQLMHKHSCKNNYKMNTIFHSVKLRISIYNMPLLYFMFHYIHLTSVIKNQNEIDTHFRMHHPGYLFFYKHFDMLSGFVMYF